MNFLIAAILDFPAKLLALVSLVWFGRRLPYISLTFLACVCFVACLFIPRGVYHNELPIVVLSMISSFCVSASFAMLWMWTSELMPTTVRNAGVGSCSFVARIGGVSSWNCFYLCDLPLYFRYLPQHLVFLLKYLHLFLLQCLPPVLWPVVFCLFSFLKLMEQDCQIVLKKVKRYHL